jgi:hypothetical protein
MRYLIIFFCLTYCVLIDAQIVRSESSAFVRTFNCGNDKDFQLCLTGNFPSLKTVTLLGETKSNTCTTKTIKAFIYSDEVFENIPATYVDFKRCKQPNQFKLAYLRKSVSEYQILNLDQNTSESTINYVDSIIRQKRMLTTKDEEFFANTLSKMPILHIPVSKHKNIYIVQYTLDLKDRPGKKYGPLFFFANGKITKIDSEAEITKAFMLNGRLYVLLDHGCWEGCGNIYTTLLEIEGNKVKIIFKDGTWAT